MTVVSMTSFPARIATAHLALESILAQTLAPSRIVLCLSRDEFPEGESGLPEALRSVVSRGVELLWADGNLKAHKKYFYTMQKYPDAAVITVDDDKIYPPTFVEEMAASYRRFPKCVTAMHAHLMTFGENGSLLPYAEWIKNYALAPNRPDLALFAVGAGGVLYPPHILPPGTFDAGAIAETCLGNDDIWLKAMEMAGGKVPVVVPPGGDRATTIESSQEVSLWSSNKIENDAMIGKAFAHVRATAGMSVADTIREEQRRPEAVEMRQALNGWRKERDERMLAAKRLADQKARADKAVADYQKLKVDLSSDIAAQKASAAEIRDRADGLSRELSAAKDALSKAKRDQAMAQGELAATKSELESRRDELAARSDELAGRQKELAKVKDELAGRQKELAKAKDELAERQKELAAARSEIAARKNELATANDRLAEAKREIADGKNEARRLESVVEESREETSQVRKEMAAEAASLRKLLDDEKHKSATVAKRLADLKRACGKLKLAKARYLLRCKKKSARLKKVSSKYKALASSKLGRLTLLWWHVKNRKKAEAMPPEPKAAAIPSGVQKRASAKGSAAASKPAAPAKRIRVLFPCGSGNNPGANPFVGTLMESLKSMGVSVSYGAGLLFEDDLPFDVVHFMWPEAVFGWSNPGATAESLARLRRAMQKIRSAGIAVVYTRHNVRPHVDANPFLAKAYELIENSADVVLHMGKRSKTDFASLHPASLARNVVVPHHTYARISRAVTKKEAREWFGLSAEDRVVLSFGVFRSDDERDLLLNAVRECEVENLKVLAPRFSDNPPPEIMALPHGRSVPEQALPLYFAAADVVFVQRRRILNSGNVPMAFYFGCACVGPNDGDVGEILKATGNPVFNPNDGKSVARAIREAFSAIDESNIGAKNRAYADGHWRQDRIAARIISEYQNAIGEKAREPAARPTVSVIVDNGSGSDEACERTKASIAAQTYDSGRIRVVDGGTFADGLAKVEDGLVLFLLRGDELSPGFIDDAVDIFRRNDVDCVVGNWSFAGHDPAETHADKALARCEEGVCGDSTATAPLSASVFGRVYRASAARGSAAIVRHLDGISRGQADTSAAGVSELADALERRRVYISKSESYYSPSGETDRETLLAQIDALPQPLQDEAVPADVKRAIVGRMQFLTDRVYAGVRALPEEERAKACAETVEREKDNPFFNRSLFCSTKAVAFCHNFPPSVDASSFVSAKRLREIDGFAGEGLNWTVITQDMRSIRPTDLDFQTFFSDIQLSRQVVRTAIGKVKWTPVQQQPYADFAVEAAERVRPEVIFSRAFYIGSHMAAYQYKQRHPEVKWYAEFSDPVAYAVDNTVRECPDVGPSWFDTEKMVYDLADVIIFTNEKQRKYMLGYNPNAEMNESIMRRSIVANHPILPRDYCRIVAHPYQLDGGRINIGYFGTFYMNRTGDDMLKLLENKNVVLHVFTTKPEEMYGQCARFGEQIRLNHTVSHLEFLNLGSKFDYLFLNDAEFVGGDNPFLPSKFADYMATGTKIIAKVQRGSTLSEIEDEHLIKVEEITAAFAESL